MGTFDRAEIEAAFERYIETRDLNWFVTGSQHLVETDGRRILLDCGLFQGHRAEARAKNERFHCGPKTLDAVILSHAHMDHCGNLPRLYAQGFRGPLFCTDATADVAELMLLDAAKIQLEDAKYLSRKLKPGHPPVEPGQAPDKKFRAFANEAVRYDLLTRSDLTLVHSASNRTQAGLQYAWRSLEMTGLVPEQNRIIEIATIVTDGNLEILAEGPVIAVHQAESELAIMDDWNTRQHGQSGLTQRVKDSRVSEAEAERQTVEFLNQWVPPNNPWYTPYVKDMPLVYYPNVIINGQTSSTYGKGSYWYQHPHHYAFSGKLSQQRGSHYLKVGSEYRYHVGIGIFPNLMGFRFPATLTADTFISPDTRRSGDEWATMLIGALDPDFPDGPSYAQTWPFQNLGVKYWAGFVHDDIKLNQRVTLNLGLRYEYEGAPYEFKSPSPDKDRLSRYLDLRQPIPEMQQNPPQIPDSVLALRNTPLALNGAWIFTDKSHRGMFDSQKTVFIPRAGVAIRVNNRTAFRAGFARYVVPPGSVFATRGSYVRLCATRSARDRLHPDVQRAREPSVADPGRAGTWGAVLRSRRGRQLAGWNRAGGRSAG